MKQVQMLSLIKKSVLGVLCGLAPLSYAQADSEAFSLKTLSVDHQVTSRPQKLNILGDKASEIMVIGLNESKTKTLDILGFDSASQETAVLKSFEIDEGIYAWDITEAEDGRLQNVYLLGKDKIYMIDQSLTIKSVTSQLPGIESMFLTDKSDAFIYQDFVKDLNQDNIDDFVLPYFTQVSVWLSDSEEYHHQALPISSIMEASSRQFTFTPRKLHFGNFSQQGTIDIAFIDQGELNYYAIDANGKFSLEVDSIELNPSIYGTDWWDIPGNDFSEADHIDVTHRSIFEIADINGDDIPDLMVNVAVSESLLSKTNDAEFYFGHLNNGRVVYTKQSQTKISTGTTMTPNLIDIDGDNKKEVLVSSFKLSLSKIISVLLSGKADIDVFVFGLQDGVYAQKPLADKEVKMRINLRSGRQTFPMIRTVDIDGNKVKDLLLSDDDEIEIHLAQQGRGSLYKRRNSTFDFAMPTDANRIAHADVNGDGKGDLVISYTQADGQEKANQVSVLYAN